MKDNHSISPKKQNHKFDRRALQVADAQALAASYAGLGQEELIRLQESDGRVLASDVIAPHPFPAFARSGMDGYAVRSADLAACDLGEKVWLEVVDQIPCGYVSAIPIEQGKASRIMTGAQVPEGADAVVMLEATELRVEDDGLTHVGFKRSIEKGKNITPLGFELQEGDLILRRGTLIGPGEISVLATFGIHQVEVYRQPVVGIFSTGTELLDITEPLEPGKIRNSNTYMLASQIREAGGVPVIMEAIPDDIELARQKVEEALQVYDIVVTTGGVSVGDYDIMGELVTSGGLDMLFNKVTMRPGSVTTAAVKEGKLLFALSGNPGACYVGFLLFVRPAIRKMLGMEQLFLTEWTAELGSDYSKVNNFTRFVRGSLEVSNGKLIATPASLDESSVMITIKDSDCLIVIPPELRGAVKGQTVQVLVLPGAWT
ncbi:molybdopterin molybdotransferase MoeA [Virgibacillus sp. LDC1]|uniref:molybdopterin molybdotransferase MoeA n=1 Tax=Paenibacillus sp. GM2FR TaxID=2059268 RepID=UPI000C2790FE|nr:gephyrin-like molybdotransferase Glp [Paenibacillus sp. GM2FR]MCV4230431.1 molybdopterin molybdotransferase MoeA [Virgibacillus sp. LDC1]PJN54233.1 Molybdopterin molybdenumtransferase [Paenibacillus sp. GM2FR]